MGKKKDKSAKKAATEIVQVPAAAARPPKVVKAKHCSDVILPTNTANLTASQLTSDQKTVIKKQCQRMYNYQHSDKRVTKIETATEQLEQMMAAKLLAMKKKKA